MNVLWEIMPNECLMSEFFCVFFCLFVVFSVRLLSVLSDSKMVYLHLYFSALKNLVSHSYIVSYLLNGANLNPNLLWGIKYKLPSKMIIMQLLQIGYFITFHENQLPHSSVHLWHPIYI